MGIKPVVNPRIDDVIIIPGIFRSGTTYVTTAIENAGVKMNDWKMQFNEDADIWGWNRCEKLTNEVDGRTVPFSWEPSKDFLERLQWYKDRNEGKSYGFKEPSIIHMIKAYAMIWPEAKYILCVRSALSSIWSQRARGNIETSDLNSLGVYGQHISNFCAVAILHKLNVHFFNYDGDSEQERQGLSDFLGLDISFDDWKWSPGYRSR